MTQHTETMWAIAHKRGLYLGSLEHTRDMAIIEHGICSVRPRHEFQDWAECEKQGDRAVKVTITYEYPE